MVAMALSVMLIIVVISTLRLMGGGGDPTAEADVEPDQIPPVSDVHDRGIRGRDDWASTLDDGLPGTFVLSEVGASSPVQAAVPGRATLRYAPGSTVDLVIVLAGPEAGAATVATLVQSVRGRDGGTDEAEGWADAATDARVSALDLIALLDALASEAFPVDAGRHAAARDAMTEAAGDGWTISYVDSTVTDENLGVAWFIGIVETDGGTWVFAHNVDVPVADGEAVAPPLEERLALVLDLLRSADAIA